MTQVRVEFSFSWFCVCGDAGDPVGGKGGGSAEAEAAFRQHAKQTDTGSHYDGAVAAVEMLEFVHGAVFMAFDLRPIDLGSLGDEDDGSVRYINMRWAWLDA